MKILFYRYGSICEPSILEAFEAYDFEVVEEASEIHDKSVTPGECAQTVSKYLSTDRYSFVFSINFYPALSEVCNLYGIPYLSWVVDCPVLELYSNTIKNPVNRIFLFDKAMYDEFHVENPDGIFYLPLAVDTQRMNLACESACPANTEKFSCDVSFVGSLYKEKSPLDAHQLSDFHEGYVNAIIDAQLKFYGVYLLRDALSDEMTANIKAEIPDFYQFPQDARVNDTAILADWYIGMKAAVVERTRSLSMLSEHFDVSVFTGSDTSALPRIHNCGRVQTLTEMPVVFRHSKINLNMTIRPIRSGLSLRVWDILGSGGFLLTNFQSELSDFFTIGEELEAYSSYEELLDKTAYYLENEKARTDIAHAGYEKVRAHHSFKQRIGEMLQLAFAH